MGVSSTSFKPGHTLSRGPRKRKKLSEAVLYNSLLTCSPNGQNEYLKIMQDCVHEINDPVEKSKAVDRYLKLVLLASKDGDEGEESVDTTAFQSLGLSVEEALYLKERMREKTSEVMESVIQEIVHKRDNPI